jgi:hypothetical protein
MPRSILKFPLPPIGFFPLCAAPRLGLGRINDAHLGGGGPCTQGCALGCRGLGLRPTDSRPGRGRDMAVVSRGTADEWRRSHAGTARPVGACFKTARGGWAPRRPPRALPWAVAGWAFGPQGTFSRHPLRPKGPTCDSPGRSAVSKDVPRGTARPVGAGLLSAGIDRMRPSTQGTAAREAETPRVKRSRAGRNKGDKSNSQVDIGLIPFALPIDPQPETRSDCAPPTVLLRVITEATLDTHRHLPRLDRSAIAAATAPPGAGPRPAAPPTSTATARRE